ncbi:MAG: hypothetical protein WC584_03685 [Candidatus Pacearchaeota archaeon]
MPHHKYPTRLKIFSENEKKEIEKKLNEQFGIKEIPGIILQRGEERLFLFQGSLSEKQIYELEQTIPIERIGVYFAKLVEEKDGKTKIRLSIEGTQIFSSQINKNIFELNDNQVEDWMKGNELLSDNINKESKESLGVGGRGVAVGQELIQKNGWGTYRGFLVMKYKNNFLGCGKASENKISNFIPKNRRLKEKSI